MDELDLLTASRAHQGLEQLLHRHVRRSGAILDATDVATYDIFRLIHDLALTAELPAHGLEVEAHRALEKLHGPLVHRGRFYVPPEILTRRDLTAGIPSAGGYLVGNSVPSFIEALHNRSIAARFGATFLGGLTSDATFPRLTSAPTTYWLSGEAVQVTESTPSAGAIYLKPRTVGAYFEMSRQFMLQGGPAAQAVLLADAGTAVATALDAAAIAGSGGSGEPLGIRNVPGITTGSGASWGYAEAVAAQQAIADANGIISPAALGWVTTPTVAGRLMQRARFSGADSPLWNGNISDAVMAGARAASTKNVPADSITLVDWSQVLIGQWGVLQIEINPFANFQAGIVGVRALWTVDTAVRHPQGVFTTSSAVT